MNEETVHIPLLGVDGRRPPMDVCAVSDCIERLIRENPIGEFQSIQDYEIKSLISRGKYSEVLKVTDDRGDELALKRMIIHSEKRLPHNAVREITILRRLNHPNVIKLQGFVADDRNAERNYFSMEYCQENVAQLLGDVSQLEQPELKCLMTMLLNGAAYLHKEHVIHRDISPKNLLIYPSGMLKIGDFGKALEWSSREKDCDLGTPGYRAPELILGYQLYTTSVDMWSIGCIFGELLHNKPVFPAKTSNINQFNKIVELVGSPVYAIVPNFHLHPFVILRMLKNQPHDNFQNWFRAAPITAINLLEKFLTYDFAGRIEAEAALKEEYFSTSPVLCRPEHLKIILDRKRKSLGKADELSLISSERSPLDMSSDSRGAVGGQELSEISSGDFSTVEEGEIQ